MAASAKRAAVQCPDSKIVLSGFSQGAQVTHKAAKLLSPSLHSRIGAIVLFGDPNKGKLFPDLLNRNVKTFCHEGDLICSGIPIPLDQHSNVSTALSPAPSATAVTDSRGCSSTRTIAPRRQSTLPIGCRRTQLGDRSCVYVLSTYMRCICTVCNIYYLHICGVFVLSVISTIYIYAVYLYCL